MRRIAKVIIAFDVTGKEQLTVQEASDQLKSRSGVVWTIHNEIVNADGTVERTKKTNHNGYYVVPDDFWEREI